MLSNLNITYNSYIAPPSGLRQSWTQITSDVIESPRGELCGFALQTLCP